MTRSNDAPRPGRSKPEVAASPVTPLRVVLLLALAGAIAFAVFGKDDEGPRAAEPAPPAPEPATAAPEAPSPPKREIAGAAHVLVAYKGAEGAPKGVTRSKDEARKRAHAARELLTNEKTSFAEAVKKYSDDASTLPTAGALGNFERNAMPKTFSDAAFGLGVGGLSEVIETPRGFHIIKRTN